MADMTKVYDDLIIINLYILRWKGLTEHLCIHSTIFFMTIDKTVKNFPTIVLFGCRLVHSSQKIVA